MKPVLKRIHSPDVFNLEQYFPPPNEPFSCLIQSMFSQVGVDGSESFDIVICNPEWIAKQIRKAGPLIGRHYLIVNDFNFEEIRNVILHFAEQCEGTNWEEIATKLSRLGHWEFEDYRP